MACHNRQRDFTRFSNAEHAYPGEQDENEHSEQLLRKWKAHFTS